MKKFKILLSFLSLFTLIMLPHICMGDTWTWSVTDPGTGGIAGNEYVLSITGSGSSFTGSLTAMTISDPGWFIDWSTLHLDGGTSPTITLTSAKDLTTNTDLTGWSATGLKDSVSVLKFGSLPDDGNTLIYNSEVVGKTEPYAVTAGAALNGDTYKWEFSLTFTTTPIWLAGSPDDPSIKVGYYDGVQGDTTNTRQLSQKMSVPEPGILILLGIAMSAVGIVSRYVRKI